MEPNIDTIRARLAELREALQQEIEARRERFRYRVRHGRVEFEQDARRAHREARESLRSFLSRAKLRVIVTAPLIYALILPIALLDGFVSLYHAICFPVYGIAKVKRADHIAIDRQHLAYLNGLQRLNCIYCGYCNGVISYVREIAARTEQYWCPIKHARRLHDTHDLYGGFLDYGDAGDYRGELTRLRAELAKLREEHPAK
ncbi:hypothetical protein ATO10_08903 [Actibacterium atlanticum]|uniref:Uncharacterized protein n=1 Tax=Actibacterium atlanticum TaxID=1461693 RepID=A0A058ZL73_9RHOB|nr:hypothetical protein [Actibacterium atlanticum]KCV81952.1 hypothetical protein ATO10_08903 [Actibacterium atlanticum]